MRVPPSICLCFRSHTPVPSEVAKIRLNQAIYIVRGPLAMATQSPNRIPKCGSNSAVNFRYHPSDVACLPVFCLPLSIREVSARLSGPSLQASVPGMRPGCSEPLPGNAVSGPVPVRHSIFHRSARNIRPVPAYRGIRSD